MGLVKTRRRLAEDMHRRGEASEGTLPKATRRARKRVRSPHRAGWKCCQCGSVASSNVANFQLGIGRGYRTEDRRQRTEDLGRWTLDDCGITEFMITYRRFQKREK